MRDIEEVLVWGRSLQKARAFSELHARSVKATIRAVPSAEEAAKCDVVCTVTGSAEPVIRGAWLQPGAHVNLVGAHTPTTRESDTTLIVRSRLYVDSIESAFKEAGDILIPTQEGAIVRSHVVSEIGELLLGDIEGRRDPAEVTVYNSLGLIVQDRVAAHAVYSCVPRGGAREAVQ